MATDATPADATHTANDQDDVLRPAAELAYASELETLRAVDDRERPPGWRLSPWAVVDYVMGTTLDDGTVITPKYIGDRSLIEVSVATLATDRALLLLGVPGTAKTWVSEHLAAAISGDSGLLVQGTAGTMEEALRYGWNYAQLLAEGPSEAALVASPVMTAMQRGAIARVEELTRMAPEVQDALVTVLSEKVLPIAELTSQVQAKRGFNVIATANNADRGVNDLSAALRRRFNTVLLPLPATVEDEVRIVSQRVGELGASLRLPEVDASTEEIRRVVTIFRELRGGATADGQIALKRPSATLSTAEAISVVVGAIAMAAHFNSGDEQRVAAPHLAAGIVGTIVQDPASDAVAWNEYLEAVMSQREEWADLYAACRPIVVDRQ